MKNIILNDLTIDKGIFAGYLLLKQKEKGIVEEFLYRLRSKNTQNGYLKELKKYFQHRIKNNMPTNESLITRGEVIVYIEYLNHKENLAPKTIHRNLSALCSFWEYLVEIEVVNFNVFKGASRNIDNKPLMPTKVLRSDQVKEVLSLSTSDVLHNTILTTLFYTGMRISELIWVHPFSVESFPSE